MDHITFLGTFGSKGRGKNTTCLHISDHIVIDAGNILGGLGEKAREIDHIFLTHSHLDHIADIPYLIDTFYPFRTKPISIYGLPETIAQVKKHIFNNDIWVDFSEINLINSNEKAIVFFSFEFGTTLYVDDIILTPVPTNHTVPSCGYVIGKQGENAVLFTADTYQCDAIWQTLNEDASIHSVVIDVSFPSAMDALAKASRHLTPALLAKELESLTRDDVSVYVNHLKPSFVETITQEIQALGVLRGEGKILQDGDRVPFTQGHIVQAADNTHTQHDRLVELAGVGTLLSAPADRDHLYQTIVTVARKFTGADAGTLYKSNDAAAALRFHVLQNNTLDLHKIIASDDNTWPALPLKNASGEPNLSLVASACANTAESIRIDDVYDATWYDFEGTRNFDARSGYRTRSMLVVPMSDHEGRIIGVLQLINKLDSEGNVIAFNTFDEQITTSLASQAAIALSNQRLINDLEQMLYSILDAIILVIDEMSPYTSGHIRRMVKLTMLLTQSIHDDDRHYSDVQYGPDALKEIELSALMHDIGKIATPNHVIDKPTRLQTLFDRIEYVKAKAEIIKRDHRIAMLEAALAAPEETARLEAEHYQWRDAFEAQIAQIVTFNRQMSITDENADTLIDALAALTLHIEGASVALLDADETLNLKIKRGTLTDAERLTINHHADITKAVLNKLNFPRKFSRIPQIASEHHEKPNKRGYPDGIGGDALSLESRILAIADIFEALTAPDRPYKHGLMLSEAMQILHGMAQRDDVDSDMVRLFYESGTYLRYAHENMDPKQIDDVTLSF